MCKIVFCRAKAFKIGISLLLFYLLSAQASVPVLSDIKIWGGSRGLAVSLSADLPFEATFKKTDDNSVRVVINDCVYGLNTFNFVSFRSGVPVTKIFVKEIKANSTVQIDIVVSDKVLLEIESQKKRNQNIALLSRSSCANFNWCASENDGDAFKKSFSAKDLPLTAPVPGSASLPTTPSAPAAPPIQTGEKEPKIAQLVNISFLQRNKICALSFELDNVAQSAIKRIKDTVFLQISQAGIGLKSNNIEVPSGTPFSAIKIKEKKLNLESLLLITITLDKKNHDFQNGVVYKKGNVITLFSNSSSDEKLSQWTNGKGVLWEQKLYQLPSYNIDMKSLEKRATADAGGALKDDVAFFTQEYDSVSNTQSETLGKNDKGVHSAAIPTTPSVPDSKKTESNNAEAILLTDPKNPEPLIVTTNNVNLRAEPSVSAEVLSKLTIGEKLELIGKKGQWNNVKGKSISGWVYQKNVTDSSKVSAAVWSEINGRQASIPQVNESPIANPVVEFGGVVDSEFKSTLDNAGLPADSGLNNNQKKLVKYNPKGRDPFLPLVTDTTEDSDDANVEHLKLVGVLFDNTEQIALFEDLKANRKPFALRENEAVEHGKVLKIYKDKVVFLMTEYGISRSYTIRLATKQEQEAGK